MLGVSTQPQLNVTGFGGFGSPSSSKFPSVPNGPPNGVPTNNSIDSEIAELKANAKEQARTLLKSKSAQQSIRAAKTMYSYGKEQEKTNDAKAALAAFIKMHQIMKNVLDTAQVIEFREAMKSWPTYAQDSEESTQIMEALEGKIRRSAEESDNSGVKSIQDRLKSLRANGLQVTAKPAKRTSPTPSLPPVQTPTSSGGSSRRMSAPPSPLKQSLRSPLEPTSPPLSPPINGYAQPTPIHSLVPTASLGDSPLSSPSQSPRIPQQNLTGLSSMPEVDDYQDAASSYPSIGQFEMQHPSPRMDMPAATAPFMARHFDPIERAASVPPAPSYSSMLPSRPSSPMKPSLQRKQSILSNGNAGPMMPPKSSATPEDLMAYKNSKAIHTLLIDVRTRTEFEKERIENQAIICIEPVILNRNGLTAEALENALELSPMSELTLFQNRHIFEYVVIYDQNSTTQSSTMRPLIDAIFVNSIHGKGLKHPPMFLIGGLDGWKQKYGDGAVVKGHGGESSRSFNISSASTSYSASRPLPMEPVRSSDTYGQTNGNGPMSPTNYSFASPPMEPTQLWSPPRSRPDTASAPQAQAFRPSPDYSHRPAFSLDQSSNHTRLPAEVNYTGRLPTQDNSPLTRRPAMVSRTPTGTGSPSLTYPNHTNGISYPTPLSSRAPSTNGAPEITSPPPVSLSNTLTRRRSDYIEHASYPISYPVPSTNSASSSTTTIARPAPAAIPGTDSRPRQMSLASSHAPPVIPPKPQFIAPRNVIPYWSDVEIGMTGLRNMGNTCYMNSAIQCLSATVPFARFFADGRWKSEVNKYALRPGAKKASKEFLDGKTSFLFANTLRTLWAADLPYIAPNDIWSHMASQYEGFNNKRQHDAGEWMGNLLALLSVELNRVTDADDGSRPDEWFLDLARRPPAESNQRAWEKELMKENSIVFDWFGSLTRTMRQCQRCMQKSPSYLSSTILPLNFLPKYGSSRLTPRQCFESIFQTDEDMKGGNKWLCPVCKSLQDAKATTRLAHAPPVLLLQLSRYEDDSNGKKKNLADFPLRDLDLSEWMVSLDPENTAMSSDDARAQRPPYRYDLYAVINHDGQTIDSGHYTSLILSGGRWKECNDSIIRTVPNSEVVTSKAYILCYKRKKT